MTFQRFGFIGLGLITGSIARAIRSKYPDAMITAYDPGSESLVEALEDGTIDKALPAIGPDFCRCEIVFLGAPVSKNAENLPLIKPYLSRDAILTDVGSVKTHIHAHVVSEGLSAQFIGGHPMTGSERVGYRNSKARLLENAYYILTPEPEFPPEKTERMKAFVASLGAMPLIIDCDEHDYCTAAISHVPHVAAAALVNLVKSSDGPDGIMKTIAAGGFKDITRISSSSPAVWQQICLSNRDRILSLLDDYIRGLADVRNDIAAADGEALYGFFDSARQYRDSFSEKAGGPILPVYSVRVDIADRPGVLARVVSLLAEHRINIRNIGIVHNREYQEGALRVELDSREEQRRAGALLLQSGYSLH